MRLRSTWCAVLIAGAVIVTMTAVADAQDLVGRWRDNTDGGITEYAPNGRFTIQHPRMPNGGSGGWTISSPGVLKFSSGGQSQICSVTVTGRTMRIADCPMVDANTGRIIYETTAQRID